MQIDVVRLDDEGICGRRAERLRRGGVAIEPDEVVLQTDRQPGQQHVFEASAHNPAVEILVDLTDHTGARRARYRAQADAAARISGVAIDEPRVIGDSELTLNMFKAGVNYRF